MILKEVNERSVLSVMGQQAEYAVEDFLCGDSKLTSLTGCPEYVGEDFYCYNNQLTSLAGCPEHVGRGQS